MTKDWAENICLFFAYCKISDLFLTGPTHFCQLWSGVFRIDNAITHMLPLDYDICDTITHMLSLDYDICDTITFVRVLY